MTHSHAFRELAAVLSVWLGICLAQPMQLHLCVMHGGLAIEPGGHSGHMGHHAASHDAHQSTSSHEKPQQCSCLGDCKTGTAPAFVGAPQVSASLPGFGRVVASSVAASTPIIASDLTLPFPNGPPGTSSLAS